MYKRILVGTDGSVHGRQAVVTGCALAAKLGARLSVVHVMGHGEIPAEVNRMVHSEHLADPPEIEIRSTTDLGTGIGYLRSIGETGIRRHQVWAALAQQLVADAKHTAEEHHLGQVDTSIEEGDPVDELMKVIDAQGPDLVVLGRRGISDLRGLLMGSVSHKVSQLARCDVLTVRSE